MSRLVLCISLALFLPLGYLTGCGPEHASLQATAPDQHKAPAPTVSTAPIPKPDPIAPEPSQSDPVKAVMECRTTSGNTAELLVAVRIAGTYYLHAEADHGGTFTPLKIEATLPPGVEFVGDWSFPAPTKERGIEVYRTSVLLKRALKITSATADSKVTGVLRYQACYDELCWPPGKLELSAPISIQAEAAP
jgi:Disulphide bond corrector protein DsbC